jgi:hypothetical protein
MSTQSPEPQTKSPPGPASAPRAGGTPKRHTKLKAWFFVTLVVLVGGGAAYA